MTIVKDDNEFIRSLTAAQMTVQICLGILKIHESLVQSVRVTSNLRLGLFPKVQLVIMTREERTKK